MKKFFLRVAHHAQGLDQAMRDLQAGGHRHDVLERGVRALELDPADDSVGFNGFPNVLGEMELDAAFMDGNTRQAGAVAGVKHFLPVSLARRLMEEPNFHVFLAGEGAERFAREKGLSPERTLSDMQHKNWQRDVESRLNTIPLAELVRQLAERKTKENRDTTIMIASDGKGMSGAASTSGWSYKYEGRAGDTPFIGAGMYVDSRFGACACTFTGEMSMRAVTARYVVAQMEFGKTPHQAVQAAIDDIARLQGGVLRTLVIHAINPEGEAYVAALNAEKPIEYNYWCEPMPRPERRKAEKVEMPTLRL